MGGAVAARGFPTRGKVVGGGTAGEMQSYGGTQRGGQIGIGPPGAGWSSGRVLGAVNRQVGQLLGHAGRPCGGL